MRIRVRAAPAVVKLDKLTSTREIEVSCCVYRTRCDDKFFNVIHASVRVLYIYSFFVAVIKAKRDGGSLVYCIQRCVRTGAVYNIMEAERGARSGSYRAHSREFKDERIYQVFLDLSIYCVPADIRLRNYI